VSRDPRTLPPDLPAPEDDGAAVHLRGAHMPDVALPSTGGAEVGLAALPGLSVVFAYPRTGRPGEEPLGGEAAWNAIPGARGCTPEACGIRDAHDRFAALGARVFGLSTQTTTEQAEAAARLGLTYPLLSDAGLELATALRLPTFAVEGRTLLKRITLVVRDGVIDDVLYPVFPPDRAAASALDWLQRV
jgi:peroxiredoxin